MKALSGKKFTAKKLAEQFGCTDKTVRNHANRLFGGAKNGVAREFDEAQVTAILESIKADTDKGRPVGDSKDLEKVLLGTETAMSLDLEIALIERKAKELWKRKALEQEARAMRAESLLVDRTSGLEAYQRIAESAGLTISDREDIVALYKRRR
jgi:transcriptional antiterminator